MKRFPMPGLSLAQRKQLFNSLSQRSAIDLDSRKHFLMPETLTHSFGGQIWWAFMMELQDRPLMTAIGLVAASTYPVVWLFKHLRHFF